MSFFDFLFPKKTIVYLDRQSLTIIKSNNENPSQLNFPSQVISYLNVLDPIQMEKIIINFLNTQKLNGNIIIVLSNDILFSAKIPVSVVQNQDQLNKVFISNIPFPAHNIETVHINTNEQEIVCIAVNKVFYQTIVKALGDFGLKIDAVVPKIPFELSIGKKIPSSALLDVINKEKGLVKKTDFLS